MATRNFVPRGDGEGSLGTSLKRWFSSFLNFLDIKNYIKFTASSESHEEGKFFYDSVSKTMSYHNENDEITVNISQEHIVRVKNVTGSDIPDGKVVRLSGSDGAELPTIDYAKADNVLTSKPLGVTTTNVPNNGTGYITVIGLIHELDTSAFTNGDKVFLSDSIAGEYQLTPGTIEVFVGYIIKSHATTGVLLVAVGESFQSSGDMLKSVYDTDDDGRVDNAENLYDGTNTTTAAQARSHIDSILNPHSVTKTQVGLGSVDNVQQLPMSYLDIDGTLAANSDTKVASQKATKTYIDNLLGIQDAMVYKGVINCSANPDYPSADAGHTYRVSVAGKIGGALGPNVEIGDLLVCTTDGSVSGDHAAVGANWDIVQTNIDGAVIGPSSAVDSHFTQFDGATGKLVKDGGLSFDTDGTLAANSDVRIASQKAVKTYSDTKSTESKVETLTNKTINANGTGNSISNLEIPDFASGVIDTDGTLAANSDSKLATQKATKTYVDALSLSVRKTVNEDLASSTTLQDDDALQLTLAASTSYTIDGYILATSASATPDIKIAFVIPSGTLNIGYMNIIVGGAIDSGQITVSGTATALIPITAAGQVIIRVFGVINIGVTGGTFKLQWAQNTSNATVTTVQANSTLRATKI